jgi:hypothetical protein
MMYYYPNAHLLNAWGSYDPEGGPVKFLWAKIGGPPQYKMLYENASTPVISDFVTGTYTFRLTVTDEQGATANTEVSFSIKVNQPPIANGFVMMYYYPNAHLLNAWGSYDPEGGQVKFWWTKIDGPAEYHMLYPEASTPVISNLVAGTYQFQLRVTDSAGATAYDTVNIVNTIPLSKTGSNSRIMSETQQGLLSNDQLLITPNPVIRHLTVSWTNAYIGATKLTVIDITGKQVASQMFMKYQMQQTAVVETGHLKPGVYYLFLETKNGNTFSKRFLK